MWKQNSKDIFIYLTHSSYYGVSLVIFVISPCLLACEQTASSLKEKEVFFFRYLNTIYLVQTPVYYLFLNMWPFLDVQIEIGANRAISTLTCA